MTLHESKYKIINLKTCKDEETPKPVERKQKKPLYKNKVVRKIDGKVVVVFGF